MAENNGDAPAGESSSLLVKVLVGLFATVIAPVLVAIGVKYTDAVLPATAPASSAKPDAPQAASAPSNPSPQATALVTNPGLPSAPAEPVTAKPAASGASPVQVIPVQKPDPSVAEKKPAAGITGDDKIQFHAVGPPQRLYNQRDRTGLYTWLRATSADTNPPGKNNDPDKIFTFHPRAGQLKISGQFWGVISTEKNFANYLLTVEYRWGTATWGNRQTKARESGILLHCVGPDDAVAGFAPQCLRCQIIEGGTGDLICHSPNADHPTSITVAARAGANKRPNFLYAPGEPLTTLTHGAVRRLGNGSDWKDETGFHRPSDVELPAGEWNQVECVCLKDRVQILVNGKLVNSASSVTPHNGRIALLSQGAEIQIRKFELQPIAAN